MNEVPTKRKVRQPLKALNKELLAILYQETGHSLEDMADMFGVTRQAVFKALKRHGIERRGKSEARIEALSKGKFEGKSTAELNESLFSQWSSPMAYLLGYIFTDGCLTNVGPRRKDGSPITFGVVISSKDRHHLEKLASILGKDIPIDTRKQGKKALGGGEDRYIHSIRFTRPRMIEDLRKLGLTERKSLTMKFPLVPDEFLRDFIRGCCDGDGSIYIQHKYPRVSFGTGSLEFIKELRDKLTERGFGRLTIHVREPGSGGRKNPHYYFSIHSTHAVAFCEWIYDNVPADLMLTRKAAAYKSWRKHHYPHMTLPLR